MKNLFTLMLLALATTISYAQDLNEPELEYPNTYRKAVYLEVFGPSVLRGISFDMRLNKGEQDGIGVRAGFGGMNISDASSSGSYEISVVTFPLEFNHLVGKKKHFFESGAGLLPAYASVSGQGDFTNNIFVQGEGFALTGGYATVGYRFQPVKNGFFFQAKYTPMFIRASGMRNYVGMGLGFSFH